MSLDGLYCQGNCTVMITVVHGFLLILNGPRSKTKLRTTNLHNHLEKTCELLGRMLFYYHTWFLAKTFFIQEIRFQNTLGCNHPKLQPFFAHKLSLVNIKSQATFLYQLKNCTQRMKKRILNAKIKQNWDAKFFLSIQMFKCISRPISNGLYTCSLSLHCQCPSCQHR